MTEKQHFLVLTGGIGGAKLALGLSHLLAPDEVSFLVNTGDDFEHFDLNICPDLDTLVYTLAGIANPDTGWGRRDETWRFMSALQKLGGDSWFQLGDQDLAMHVLRTAGLKAGRTLTEVTQELSGRLGVEQTILPMSDQPVRTRVHTPEGELAFQHYFVRDRCQPVVTGFQFVGAREAQLNPAAQDLLTRTGALSGIILCPSNPYVSIDPMLSLPAVRGLLKQVACPVIAVSPVVGGNAIKGPTVKMMQELNIPHSSLEVARHYQDFLDGYILDLQDAGLLDETCNLGMSAVASQTVMVTLQDKIDLARDVLNYVDQLNQSTDRPARG